MNLESLKINTRKLLILTVILLIPFAIPDSSTMTKSSAYINVNVVIILLLVCATTTTATTTTTTTSNTTTLKPIYIYTTGLMIIV